MKCPNCETKNVRIVDQQLKELKQDETIGYATKLDVKLIMETHYRCRECDHKWTVTAPEN
jgi:DNA-directed RNA polymerase subunit M/transcription elongation factor TFIIS